MHCFILLVYIKVENVNKLAVNHNAGRQFNVYLLIESCIEL